MLGCLLVAKAVVCVDVVFFYLCVCFFSVFFIFSFLCSCVGQTLLGHIKIVCVTAFLLMKNMFKHGREKNTAD